MSWLGSILLGILASPQMQSLLRTALKAGGGWLIAQGLASNDVNTLVSGATAVAIGLINSLVAHAAPVPAPGTPAPVAPIAPTPVSMIGFGYQRGWVSQARQAADADNPLFRSGV
jgi:hypothetical protein